MKKPRAFLLLLVTAALLLSAQAWAEMKSVGVKTANFRQGPSATADVLFTADRHYPVNVLERKRGWAKIKDFEGETAWVAERLLVRQKSVVVTVERAVVRGTPDPEGKIVFQVGWSDAFAVKRSQGAWVFIEGPGGKQGWLNRSVTWGFEK